MRVRGEAFFLLNGWMDYLCLYLAAAMGRTRFSRGRTALAALLGALYAAGALSAPDWVRGIGGLTGCCLAMAFIAFGRRFLRLAPLVFLSGWMLAGLTDFLLLRGWAALGIVALCGGGALGISLLLRRTGASGGGGCRVRIVWRGRAVCLPAIRDTGNLLTDRRTGLPVIVASARALRPLLPEGVRADDLSTLPPGFHLIRAATAAGGRTLMCFLPHRLTVVQGGKEQRVEAAVALSGFREGRALLPDAIFSGEGERNHAGG